MRARTVTVFVLSVVVLATLGTRLVQSRAIAAEVTPTPGRYVELDPDETLKAVRIEHAKTDDEAARVELYFPHDRLLCHVDADSETGLVVVARHVDPSADVVPNEATAGVTVRDVEVPARVFWRLRNLARVAREVAEYAETVRSDLDASQVMRTTE